MLFLSNCHEFCCQLRLEDKSGFFSGYLLQELASNFLSNSVNLNDEMFSVDR